MKIDFNIVLKAISGEQLEKQDEENKKSPMTLCDAAVTALVSQLTKADASISGKEKFDRYQLAQKIYGKQLPVELTLDEVKKIKDRIGEVCSPVVVGEAWPILDPVVDESKEEKAE